MPLRIQKGETRKLPDIELTPRKGSGIERFDSERHARDLARTLDLRERDRSREMDEIKRATIDRRDEIAVTSTGSNAEVSVRHELGFAPDRYTVVSQDGPGSLFVPKNRRLGTNEAVRFKCSADSKGTTFRVVLYVKDEVEE
jgi:hypothetical protein